MDQERFNSSLLQSKRVLKRLELFKGEGVKDGKHSDEFKKISRKNKYTQIYQVAIDNLDYELLLKDNSLFQFSYNEDVLRYAFIQNPQVFADKMSYLRMLYTQEDLNLLSTESVDELLDEIKDEEYEQFLNEQEINVNANYIRYDFDSKGYDPLIHSHSHIHIGLNRNLRIPCSRILSPLMFVYFCIKHSYFDDWEGAIKKEKITANEINSCKIICTELEKSKWVDMEKVELYLS